MITIPKKWWLRIGAVLLVVISLVIGYYARGLVEANIQYHVVSVNTPDEVTSAITDRWELQLTDRTNGRVRIYDKNILDAIFYQYMARRSYTQEDRKP